MNISMIIVGDKLMNNNVQLSINRRALLRQYYGLPGTTVINGICNRSAFGYKNGRQVEGIDSRHIYITVLFPNVWNVRIYSCSY